MSDCYVDSCPVCNSKKKTLLLCRHDYPIASSKYTTDKNSAVAYPRGELDMVICENCGMIYNRKYNPDIAIYDNSTCNERNDSVFFSNYISSEAEYIASMIENGSSVI